MPRLYDVALPLPLFRNFTYAEPEGVLDDIAPGTRVVVPLRSGREIGVVLGPSTGAGLRGAAKRMLAVPDHEPAVGESILALCRWIAEYYVVPLGVALRSALPVLLSSEEQPAPPVKQRRVVSQHRHIESLLEREQVFSRAPQQRALFELLEQVGGRSPVEHLVDQLHFSPSVLKGLVQRGLITIESETVARDPFAGRATGTPQRHAPTAAQQAAVDATVSAAPGDVCLLHGVTGSGKTLVYIELLKHVVEKQGKSAIVLVPEIALTPQTVDRFRSVFGDQVAVLHSALSDGERYDAWLALKRGDRRIAVGARSAVFAPLPNLGAIVVDEEHESSYKQGETPRYHARECAIVRARLEGAVVVLGSATPSLESWTNAGAGKYRLLSLPDRVGGGRLPAIDVVDMKKVRPDPQSRVAGPLSGLVARVKPDEVGAALRAHASAAAVQQKAGIAAAETAFRLVVSEALETALADRLERGEQSILLLNRRGYASFVQCADCGNVAVCPNCSITLTYHRAPERLVCHYCQHSEPTRTACERCNGPTIRQRGLGTQQVERLLAERFPAARIARMDVDTTSAKWAHADILDRVGRGETDILLGTQMIAKGLDFPNVTLVGVIDADVGINLPDFRASERCFQLLSQVAGRAGRGPKGGRVIIQTRVPQHHAVRCAVAHDYQGFVTQELEGREHPAYPPSLRLANVIFSGTVEEQTAELADHAAQWLRRLLETQPESGLTVVGPAPCPVERIKNRWRWHLLIKAPHAGELTRVARYFLERFPVPANGALRVALDRDPVALL